MAVELISKADLEEVWRRVLPKSYTRPIETEADGQGFDIVSAQAAIWARVDEAVNRMTQAAFLKAHSLQTEEPAMGARRATGNALVARAAPTDFDITLPAGTELQATFVDMNGETQLGPIARLTSELEMLAGSIGPFGTAIEASRPGFHGNIQAVSSFVLLGRATIELATVILAGNDVENAGTEDIFTVGMSGTQYLRFDSGPNAGETRRIVGTFLQADGRQGATVDGAPLLVGAGSASVLEHEDMGLTVSKGFCTGGRDAWLDALGEERAVYRRLAEGDELYRARACALADTISPAAIMRICSRVLGPLGIGWLLKETRDIGGLPGLILDLHPHDFGDVSDGQVLLDSRCGAVRFFVICVGPSSLGEFGAPNDALAPPNPNALEVMFLDGYPATWAGALGALWQELFAARAAGICFSIQFDPDL